MLVELTKMTFITKPLHNSLSPSLGRLKIMPCQLQPQGPAKNCPKCRREFGFTLWKYNCHICGLVVCDDCAPNKYVIPGGSEDPEKVCKDCEKKKGNEGLKTSDGGRKLGGGEAPPPVTSEDAERERRAKLAEERMKNSSRRGIPTSTSSQPPRGAASSSSSAAPQSHDIARANSDFPAHDMEKVKQQEKPSAPVTTSDPPTAAGGGSSNPVLDAALRRQQSSQLAGGPRVDPEKQLLLAEIHQVLVSRGEEEPFGLRSMEPTKLRLYLNHLTSKK